MGTIASVLSDEDQATVNKSILTRIEYMAKKHLPEKESSRRKVSKANREENEIQAKIKKRYNQKREGYIAGLKGISKLSLLLTCGHE